MLSDVSLECVLLGIALLFLVTLAATGFQASGGTGTALVLKRFKIEDSPQTDLLIDITGRRGGISACLLTAMGFETEVTIKVTQRETAFKTNTIYGREYRLYVAS